MKYLVTGLVVLMCCGSLSAQTRVWSTKDGFRFLGTFERENAQKFYFRGEDGKAVSVATTNMVPNDLNFIRSMVPPQFSIKVDSDIEEDIWEFAANTDTRRIVTATVEIQKTSRPPYTGTLKGVVCLVGYDLNTERKMMLRKAEFPIRFASEKKAVCEFSVQALIREYEEYTDEMRGWDYSGYAVFVYDKDELLGYKTNVGWLDEEYFDRFLEYEEWAFFDEECRRQSVPQPPYTPSRFW